MRSSHARLFATILFVLPTPARAAAGTAGRAVTLVVRHAGIVVSATRTARDVPGVPLRGGPSLLT